jgi:Tfp pilus assembly protein PilO
MTGRDRLGLIGLLVAAVLVGVWFVAIAPEREKAAALSTQVSTASEQLQSAETGLASAHSAEARYPAAYASIVSLGKAVPATGEVPSLLYQLANVAENKHVEFNSITNGTSAGAGTPAAAAAGFVQMPFTLTFSGTYSDLYGLFQALDSSAVRTSAGGLRISGRLLTVSAIKLAPASTGGTASSGTPAEQVTGTITATAYVLPASQGLTAGATASSPVAATPSKAAPSAATPSSPTTPAVARVSP